MTATDNSGTGAEGEVDVGGVTVTASQLADAIGALENDHSTSVKQPLQRIDNPLWQSDYHAVAAAYRSEHPTEELAAGTPTQKSAHVKSAFLKHLKQFQPAWPPSASSSADMAFTAASDQVEHEINYEPPPDSDYDARKRVYAQILRRRGQQQFRAHLMHAYSGRCAITGCEAPDALEAAHLRPYRGPASNTVTNGLLLRADIHTLFDLKLLAIDPTTHQVVVSQRLIGTEYGVLSGAPLSQPALPSQRPSQHALDLLWQEYVNGGSPPEAQTG
jgi:HNH endonuclease